MISEYVQATFRKAKYELLPNEGNYYGEIPGSRGVYVTASTLEACREEPREVLEEWILFRVSKNLPFPRVEGLRIRIQRVA
ncbi:MAG: type II toxin-antitoxin system HicB family antitoxin [Dehalococcoidia bacterium]|nr:type II toxin-antitoxin system HicB family antitoxin [Dehalococcoidia bacterium]